MPNSSPTRFANFLAYSTVSSMLMFETGTKGQTSVAPKRGCSPFWWRMSMTSAAFFMATSAASTTSSGVPTNVTTVRLVAAPGSTSSNLTPSIFSISSVICLITVMSRPSLKLGTHSISCLILILFWGEKWIAKVGNLMAERIRF